MLLRDVVVEPPERNIKLYWLLYEVVWLWRYNGANIGSYTGVTHILPVLNFLGVGWVWSAGGGRPLLFTLVSEIEINFFQLRTLDIVLRRGVRPPYSITRQRYSSPCY